MDLDVCLEDNNIPTNSHKENIKKTKNNNKPSHPIQYTAQQRHCQMWSYPSSELGHSSKTKCWTCISVVTPESPQHPSPKQSVSSHLLWLWFSVSLGTTVMVWSPAGGVHTTPLDKPCAAPWFQGSSPKRLPLGLPSRTAHLSFCALLYLDPVDESITMDSCTSLGLSPESFAVKALWARSSSRAELRTPSLKISSRSFEKKAVGCAPSADSGIPAIHTLLHWLRDSRLIALAFSLL